MSQKIAFKVSARTARLIGRENVATSRGAIIELVKNGYDADSPVCMVLFDVFWNEFHEELTDIQYAYLKDVGIDTDLLESIYDKKDDTYLMKIDTSSSQKLELTNITKELSSINIVDFGEGMTQYVIQNFWMTIGTSNKEYSYLTTKKRVKAGAKGIGRFALDKLGSKCTMSTFFNPSYHVERMNNEEKNGDVVGYKWTVNWDDFERDVESIDNIGAEIEPYKNLDYQVLLNGIPFFQDLCESNPELEIKYGTLLRITNLRDNWTDYTIKEVFSDLELLVPPMENSEFRIFLYSTLPTYNIYGEVTSSFCDDYDYKIVAKADNEQNVKITIYRNEQDLDLIPSSFFEREKMKNYPYTLDTFRKGFWQTEYTFSQLIPGFASVDKQNLLKKIGAFDFAMYYMKKAFTEQDAKRFYYKKFNVSLRKTWTKNFGGIKLYRDSFRIRPYGEQKDAAFDWLGLGQRKAKSPSGIAKGDNGYRVEPENVTGTINISRIANANFEDKSSREGLQETPEFSIFKKLILGIINVFEKDRAAVAYELDQFYKSYNVEEKELQEALKFAQQAFSNSKNKSDRSSSNKNEQEKKTIALLGGVIEEKEQLLQKLNEEQNTLRAIASNGIVMIAFSHDLSKLSTSIEGKYHRIVRLITPKLPIMDYDHAEDRKNPYAQLKSWYGDNVKMNNWLKFALGTAKKDRRKRVDVKLKGYFERYELTWTEVLNDRGIKLSYDDVEENIVIRALEIDLDSIFNNLLVNSIDAIVNSKSDKTRAINISAKINKRNEIIIEYKDSGDGLSKDIKDPNVIFEPFFTTRRKGENGDEDGTGLGMWILKNVVQDYNGQAEVIFPEYGFGLRITIPNRIKKTK